MPLFARTTRGVAGLGIAYVMEPLVRSYLLRRQLTEVLPKAASRAAKIRAFLDVVHEANAG